MEGILINNYDPPEVSIIAPTIKVDLGSGLIQSTRRWKMVRHEFSYQFSVQETARAEEFRYAIKFLQGDREILFDGGVFGDLGEPQFIAYGDGSKQQFDLPDSLVHAPSFMLYINGLLYPQWTLDEDAGQLTIGFPPPLNASITAQYRRMFKCKILSDDKVIFTQTDNFKFMSTGEIKLREVP